MITSQKAIDLIKSFEGLLLTAYPDPGTGKEPITIGYGCTVYPDGNKVKMGDVITKENALRCLVFEVDKKALAVDTMTAGTSLTQNQFDALVSFGYNVGLGALLKSTLLKKVKVNPFDASIYNEFKKWNRAGGKVMAGLTRRREAEANLYFTKIV